MDEAIEVQALEKISTEVDDSQVKVILSTQCIKAQAFLVDKLRKQSDRHKEVCSFISSANIKLDAEIKQAEQEIRSLTLSQETIRLANIELRKDWLLAKENRIEILERINEGEKKYENMWLEAKSRYEKIPFVRKFLQAKDKKETIEQNINQLSKDADELYADIKKKRVACSDEDKKRILELAEFIVNEVPKVKNNINDQTKAIKELEKELATINLEQEATLDIVTTTTFNVEQNKKNDAFNLTAIEDTADSSNDDDFLLLPKLKLATYDLDSISEKLNQIRKDDVFKTPLPKTDVSRETNLVTNKLNYTENAQNTDYLSSYFNNSNVYEEDRTQNFAKRKLINILEDIQIDKSNAYNIVSKVNPQKMQTIHTISADINRAEPSGLKINSKSPIESEYIEELDLTAQSMDILIPPTQFLDQSRDSPPYRSQEHDQVMIQITTPYPNSLQQSSQESSKKKVTFDLASSQTKELAVASEEGNKGEENNGNVTLNSQLNESAVSDDLTNIKEMVMKKHQLDLSPEFVYAKNTLMPMQKNDDNAVTSKFFKENQHNVGDADEDMDVDKHDESEGHRVDTEQSVQADNDIISDKIIHMDVDEINNMVQKSEKPVAGFLFTHGTQAIPDSLNVSMSTTGYEDGDADFPHCIDSSLLLSPKADLPVLMSSENPEVLSQDVPNFLSGLRNTGLSFFGRINSSEPKPDTSAKNQGNSFNFNFGGDEKKNRGGLFSMFQ